MRYYYISTINNNVIRAVNESGHEIILMGKAIGIKCNRHHKAPVDEHLIERVFVNNNAYLSNIIDEIPSDIFEVTSIVINEAEKELDTKFRDSIFLALLDHIYFVYQSKDKEKILNPLLNEIKMFHEREMQAAKHSIEIVNSRLHTHFDEQEAAYIAFHYIDATSNLSNKQTKEIMSDLNKTIDFIKSLVKIDENSVAYKRLMIHLKCLFTSIMTGEDDKRKMVFDKAFESNLRNNYASSYYLAEKIKKFIKEELNLDVKNEESAYLAMHIVPLLHQ